MILSPSFGVLLLILEFRRVPPTCAELVAANCLRDGKRQVDFRLSMVLIAGVPTWDHDKEREGV